MSAYYNEIDPFAAEWLRELIKVGVIAPGEVDERSIEDVVPADIRGFSQHHFFAGIGVWSYALRQAGWSDDRPVWTGSCPCQPFSAAGKGAGFADERHLWPAFFHLIEQCCPAIVFGEQVASKAVQPWIDLVQADLEAVGYAFGCVPFPSASVGAPHIRDRAYWVADASGLRRREWERLGDESNIVREGIKVGRCLHFSFLANASGERLERCDQGEMGRQCKAAERGGRVGELADPEKCGRGKTHSYTGRIVVRDTEEREPARLVSSLGNMRPRPTNGFWRDADWLLCRDGKWRPVEPGTFPLVNGAAQRVGRLRGYGNAINAEAAKAFIEAFMEITK